MSKFYGWFCFFNFICTKFYYVDFYADVVFEFFFNVNWIWYKRESGTCWQILLLSLSYDMNLHLIAEKCLFYSNIDKINSTRQKEKEKEAIGSEEKSTFVIFFVSPTSNGFVKKNFRKHFFNDLFLSEKLDIFKTCASWITARIIYDFE